MSTLHSATTPFVFSYHETL